MLDSIENRRESFVVMRRGRPVATVGPAKGSTGRDLKEVLTCSRTLDARASNAERMAS
jgi:hypothetical protein